MTPIHHTTCRVCGFKLTRLWHLGDFGIVGFPAPGEPVPETATLELAMCVNHECQLVQLAHTVPAERLFREYWYRSGTNEQMVKQLEDVVRQATARVGGLTDQDTVVDIGANDGTLLSFYREPWRIALEPSNSVQERLRLNCNEVVQDFFPCPLELDRPAKIVTAIAMAYDLEDPVSFFAGVRNLLQSDGLFVLQVGYLGTLLFKNAFDSICHEHLEYYSVKSLLSILARVGLGIEDLSFNDSNGGSVRCYIRHAEYLRTHKVQQVVLQTMAQERELHEPERYAWLKERVERIRAEVLEMVRAAVGAGLPVDLMGASTKGLTLVQHFGLEGKIRWAVDRNPEKENRYYGGTGIRIIGEDQWDQESPPAFSIVLPWHFKKSIRRRVKGGLLFPLPEVKLITD